MKIALLAPLYYALEEKSDGGIETFLFSLAKQLVNRGHDVDVYTVKQSLIAGTIISVYDQPTSAVTDDPYIRQSREIAGTVKTFKMVEQSSKQYDVVHNSQINFYAHLQAAKLPNCITTLHSPPDYYPILQAKDIDDSALSQRVVAISDFQKDSSEHGFIGRVYNGIDCALYDFVSQPTGDYLAWMGRLIPQKGVEDAIHAALETKTPLQFAGSPWDSDFYKKIMDLTDQNELLTFLGHADTELKNKFIGNARALVFPSHYKEFGYVRLEAMACGTPVITYDQGPASEIVIDGVTGFLCPPGDTEALKSAITKIMTMPEAEYLAMRQACRKHVLENFTIEGMTDGYEAIYQQIVKTGGKYE